MEARRTGRSEVVFLGNIKRVCFISAIIIALFAHTLFGENISVSVHDWLDMVFPQYQMYHNNQLTFQFDYPTKAFEGLSTVYYSHINFSLTSLLSTIFDPLIATNIIHCLSVVLGWGTMYLLLGMFTTNHYIALWVSLSFALLPTVPYWRLGFSSIPLIVMIFIYLSSWPEKTFNRKVLLLFLFPFISTFAAPGIFVLGLWFFCAAILCFMRRKFNINLLAGFIVLLLGYVIVDLRLFYSMFVLKEALNRNVFLVQGTNFFVSFLAYITNGNFHAATMQRLIIFPTAFVLSIYFFILTLLNIKSRSGIFQSRVKNAIAEMDKKVKLLFALDFAMLFFSAIAALQESKILAPFMKQFIPILDAFNWGRIYTLNRVVWYVIFAICLSIILEIRKIEFNFKMRTNLFPLNKFIAYVLLAGQIAYVLLSPVPYNDQVRTWANELLVKNGIANKFIHRKFGVLVSYKEFFSKKLFDKIKADIAYTDEKVAAFGYHPAVLMYNGFNCIDGYNNVYPLKYMQKFRTLIAPELDINEQAKEYYDLWGRRMYLYNTWPNNNLNFDPTRKKDLPAGDLNIDMKVFKNDFNGKYILSSVEIFNAVELNLKLIKIYDDEDSIYRIYLYEV